MSNKYIGLESIIPSKNIRYDESMKNHTTMKVGGICECLVIPETLEEILAVIKYAKENNIKYYVIGNGSNLLVKDEGISYLIIKITSSFSNVEINGNTIKAESGCSIPKLSLIAKNNSLSGLEFACGIPGTLGGAVRMNAGAYGSEMVDVIEEVGYLDENGDLKIAKNEELEFSYRSSMFVSHKEYIIIYAILKLKEGNVEEISKIMETNMTSRKEKQPIEFPNFGSVFKRPEGHFVGKLIDDCGLKGYTIGGAQISTKHSGFMINTGSATCEDVLNLIKYIKEEVYKKFEVKLHEEVEILGGEK